MPLEARRGSRERTQQPAACDAVQMCSVQVWKTRMGRFRNEGAIEAFKNVYVKGGGVGCALRHSRCAFAPRCGALLRACCGAACASLGLPWTPAQAVHT